MGDIQHFVNVSGDSSQAGARLLQGFLRIVVHALDIGSLLRRHLVAGVQDRFVETDSLFAVFDVFVRRQGKKKMHAGLVELAESWFHQKLRNHLLSFFMIASGPSIPGDLELPVEHGRQIGHAARAGGHFLVVVCEV